MEQEYWQWFKEQGPDCYAVVDPLANCAPHQKFFQLGGKDALPILTQTRAAKDASSGPWLLPRPDRDFLAWMFENREQRPGIFLSSGQDVQLLRQHLASLFWAIQQGEEVIFRYYDPGVIGPMAERFELAESRAFLGPIQSLLAISGEQIWTLANAEPQGELRSAPWWKIEDHHLPDNSLVGLHNLERWLWRHLEAEMMKIYGEGVDIAQTLKASFERERQSNPSDIALLNSAMDLIYQNTELSIARSKAQDADYEIGERLRMIFLSEQEGEQGYGG